MNRRARAGRPIAGTLVAGTLVAVTVGCAGADGASAPASRPQATAVTSSTPGSSALGSSVPSSSAAFVWDDWVWFGDTDVDAEDFVDGELVELLGGPGRPVAAATPLAPVVGGATSYVNGVGETVPVLVRAPGGEPFDGALGDATGSGVVVALHQTNDVGGEEPCGAADAPLAYGTAFAQAGYLVLCPTLSFTGARQPTGTWDTAAFYEAFPAWSAMGKDVAEVSWLLDGLAAAGVELDRVVVAGHSQGAIYGLYAAAIDDRIDVVVANAGFVDTPTDPDPERWSRPSWYRAFPDAPDGLDMLEVVAAVAPRCALLNSYRDDEILVATTPSPERLAAFEQQFPTIDWDVRPGGHGWAGAAIENDVTWVDGAWTRCPS